MQVRELGTVAGLWRYPVKSMLGEACERLALNRHGVDGDRRYAVRDAAGKLGSGKDTRRFRKIDGLFGFRAGYRGRIPQIRFPDGGIMRGDDAAIDRALSDALGLPLTLSRESEVAHLDAGPVHVITSAALAWLQERLPDAAVDERRFRPNLVLDVPGDGPVEHDWLGAELVLGDAVRLRVTGATERCGMVAFAQSDLPDDARILGQISRTLDLRFGVYAEVVVPGEVQSGAAASLRIADRSGAGRGQRAGARPRL